MRKPTEVSLTPNPTMAETLYAQRLAAGQAPMPEDGDPAFTPGVRTALAATEQRNQNTVLADMTANVDQSTSGSAPNMDVRDQVNQLIGQVQMANSFARFADVVSLQKLAHIKETKAYRAVAGVRVTMPGGEIADVSTWDGFCKAMGMSHQKVDEDLRNLHAFGEQALENLSRIGAGYRELRQFRRLPDDEKAALIEAAGTGDKEILMDLAERLIARQVKEKEVLERRAEEADAKAANASAELELSQGQIKRLEQAATRTRLTTFTARTEEVREECLALGKGVEVHLNGLRMQFEEIAADHVDAEHRLRMEQVWVAAHLAAARALDLVAEMTAAWGEQDMPARILSQHCLTPEEAARWLHDAPLIESRADAEKLLRAQKRAAEQPRKAGRPKGSKNKE